MSERRSGIKEHPRSSKLPPDAEQLARLVASPAVRLRPSAGEIDESVRGYCRLPAGGWLFGEEVIGGVGVLMSLEPGRLQLVVTETTRELAANLALDVMRSSRARVPQFDITDTP